MSMSPNVSPKLGGPESEAIDNVEDIDEQIEIDVCKGDSDDEGEDEDDVM